MTAKSVSELTEAHGSSEAYAYLDERSKRDIRRSLLKALAIPGWQVPFTSREMPVARGWGSGGLQVTMSLVGPEDVVKVIDQGDDDSANASAMRELISSTADCGQTTRTKDASIIQSRHRIPEVELTADQILVLQVPHPEPLRRVVGDDTQAGLHHADGDYTPAWVDLYDDLLRHGEPRTGADYPVLVEGQILMSPSPIPRFDVLRLSDRVHPIFLGAGRKARVMALPPHTEVVPMVFGDAPLQPETAKGPCHRCGSADSYRIQSDSPYQIDNQTAATDLPWRCSDTDACRERRNHVDSQ